MEQAVYCLFHFFSLKKLIMKNNSLSKMSRIILGLCGVLLLAVLYFPIWRIDLDAPQYPEGLRLLIYANNLGGDVEIINGLNHYIGMKTLHANEFIEFTILPYIIAVFAILFLLTAFLAKRKWLNITFGLFVAFGIIAMIDFWRWEYDYGHNLDPNAAIIVPGMAYQPPLIGFKQLLNFGAYSIPDIGGWIFIFVGVLALACIIYESGILKRTKKISFSTAIFVPFFLLLFFSCNTGPQSIQIGKDQCSFCKMTISDKRFGAELITQKGKVFKFDDISCVVAYFKIGLDKSEIKNIYHVNYSHSNQLFDSKNAYFLQSENIRTPMGSNVAAFNNIDSLKSIQSSFGGNLVIWDDLLK